MEVHKKTIYKLFVTLLLNISRQSKQYRSHKKYLFYIIIFVICLFLSGFINIFQDQINKSLSYDEYYINSAKENILDKNLLDNKNELVGKVINVIDGDTIEVKIENKVEKVRMIGVNTPELKDERKEVQCLAQKSKEYTKDNLLNKEVRIELDQTQGTHDKYGRMLGYIFIDPNKSFNEILISGGYAYEFIYKIPYKYRDEFKKAQKIAQQNKLGLWGENKNECIGNLKFY